MSDADIKKMPESEPRVEWSWEQYEKEQTNRIFWSNVAAWSTLAVGVSLACFITFGSMVSMPLGIMSVEAAYLMLPNTVGLLLMRLFKRIQPDGFTLQAIKTGYTSLCGLQDQKPPFSDIPNIPDITKSTYPEFNWRYILRKLSMLSVILLVAIGLILLLALTLSNPVTGSIMIPLVVLTGIYLTGLAISVYLDKRAIDHRNAGLQQLATELGLGATLKPNDSPKDISKAIQKKIEDAQRMTKASVEGKEQLYLVYQLIEPIKTLLGQFAQSEDKMALQLTLLEKISVLYKYNFACIPRDSIIKKELSGNYDALKDQLIGLMKSPTIRQQYKGSDDQAKAGSLDRDIQSYATILEIIDATRTEKTSSELANAIATDMESVNLPHNNEKNGILWQARSKLKKQQLGGSKTVRLSAVAAVVDGTKKTLSETQTPAQTIPIIR